MRPGRTPTPPQTLTRRALGTRVSGAAAAIGFGHGAAARGAANPMPVLDPDLRDAALRSLALAGYRGDPVTAAAANAALARLAETDPEAGLLGRIYQMLDVRPAAYGPDNVPAAAAADLAILHTAIRASQPVAFGYTDLEGNKTTRVVLPLVHPPQGVKLMVWCVQRQDFRQFFVRSMQGPTPQPGDFSDSRMSLLEGLLDKYTGRACPSPYRCRARWARRTRVTPGGMAGGGMARRGLRPSYEILYADRAQATVEASDALRIPFKSSVFHSRRILKADDQPIGLALFWIPLSTFGGAVLPTIDDLNRNSLYRWLNEKRGVIVTRARETIESALAEGEVAAELTVIAGKAILVVRRRSDAEEGSPIACAVLHFRADRYRLHLEAEVGSR